MIQRPAAALGHEVATCLAQAPAGIRLDWRSLTVTGPDSETLLQGQMTADARAITEHTWQLTTFLNLKGRIEIDAYLRRCPDGFELLTRADAFDRLGQRLKKYGAFSRVHIQTGSDAWIGYTCDPEAGNVCLPGLRFESSASPSVEATVAEQMAWHTLTLTAGHALLEPDAVGLYQPEELALSQWGAVSFQKGCYLGQEIVARLHFRGQLKTQRLVVAVPSWTTSEPVPPTLFQGETSVGTVIQVGWLSDTTCRLVTLWRPDRATDAPVTLTGLDTPITVRTPS